ncbi:MAG TPA: ribbon-helix-helix protein, CopG family [Acidobacteriota bacterium]|jgi:metal-responsive CopG/Arc/MetJ family transcriptional regulator
MKTIAITIEESALEQIDRVGRRDRRKRVNRSEVIRRAVHEYVSRLEREAEEERERAIVHRHRERLRRQATELVRQQAKL